MRGKPFFSALISYGRRVSCRSKCAMASDSEFFIPIVARVDDRELSCQVELSLLLERGRRRGRGAERNYYGAGGIGNPYFIYEVVLSSVYFGVVEL